MIMSLSFWYFLTLACAVSLQVLGKNDLSVNLKELLLVQVVMRHGERTNLYEVPRAGFSSNQTQKPQEAQLTAAGVKMMYEEGKSMRHRYQPFFDDGEMSVAQAVKIMSTATDRTITSAEAFAAGLIPPTGPKRRWNSSLGQQWRPFPVYTLPLRHDSLLLNFNDDCPMMTSRRKATAELPLAKQLETELQDFRKKVVAATGIQNYDFWQSSTYIEDALRYAGAYISKANWPKWLTSDLLGDFHRIADMRMHLLVGGNGDRNRTRLKVGHLLDDILHRMTSTLEHPEENHKLVFYCGHDENVAGILAALNLYNYTLTGPNIGIPEFGSLVIMELYRNNTVRLLLKNNAPDKPRDLRVLIPPRCQEFCPLEKLRQLLQDVTVTEKQWQAECGAHPRFEDRK